MTKLPWFRMFCEAKTDRKLLSLTRSEHFVWFQLLCHAAEQEVRGCIIDDDRHILAIELGMDEDELAAGITRLERLHLVDMEDGFIVFPKFADRQYAKPSDMPERVRSRVAKHRAGGDQHAK